MSVPRVIRPSFSLQPEQIESVWGPLSEALLESNEPVDLLLTPKQAALLKQKLIEKGRANQGKKGKRKTFGLLHR